MNRLNSEEKGIFIISLDLEMMWGCHDWSTPENYGTTNIKNVRPVLKRILDLFRRYDIHATVGMVGMLMNRNKADLLNHIPPLKPSYSDPNLSPYKNNYISAIPSQYEDLYFAADLLSELKDNPYIDLGSHTYCHYFCSSKGQNKEQFKEDLKMAIGVADEHGVKLNSLIFPKNQISSDYLTMVKNHGFRCYRGLPKHFFSSRSRLQAKLFRIGRLVDTYFPLVKNTYGLSVVKNNQEDKPINVPASRFFRPYDPKLKMIDGLALRRIKREIKNAAMSGKIYHLWWHPHNFGANMEKNLDRLEEILRYVSVCKSKYGLKCMHMNEVASMVEAEVHDNP